MREEVVHQDDSVIVIHYYDENGTMVGRSTEHLDWDVDNDGVVDADEVRMAHEAIARETNGYLPLRIQYAILILAFLAFIISIIGALT